MSLAEKILEIKEQLAQEERVAVNKLKEDVSDAIMNNLEKWLREGLKKVVVYPLTMSGSDFEEMNKNNISDGGGTSPLNQRELMLFNYLANTERLTVKCYLVGADPYLTIDL